MGEIEYSLWYYLGADENLNWRLIMPESFTHGIEWLLLFSSVLTIVFSMGAAWGVTRATLQQHIKTIDAMDKKMTTALYERNGLTVFMPRSECVKDSAVIAQAVNEIKSLIREMDTKREESREETSTELKNLAKTVNQLVGRLKVENN